MPTKVALGIFCFPTPGDQSQFCKQSAFELQKFCTHNFLILILMAVIFLFFCLVAMVEWIFFLVMCKIYLWFNRAHNVNNTFCTECKELRQALLCQKSLCKDFFEKNKL